MKKTKALLISLMCIEIVSFILVAVLFAFGVINIALFFILLTIDIILLSLNLFLLIKLTRKIKKNLLKLESKSINTSGDFMTDIYAILGIPKQYNPDGSLMSIYELLKIHPIYDETGTRLLTPYELLGILPKFDKNINEIPYVFVIKNRVGKIAKVDLTKRVLTRKLTEEEREQQIIARTLKERLAEAEKLGDTQKAQIIQKAIVAQKAEVKKKEIKYTQNTKFDKISVVNNSKAKLNIKKYPRLFEVKPRSSAASKPVAEPSQPVAAPSQSSNFVQNKLGGGKILSFNDGRNKSGDGRVNDTENADNGSKTSNAEDVELNK